MNPITANKVPTAEKAIPKCRWTHGCQAMARRTKNAPCSYSTMLCLGCILADPLSDPEGRVRVCALKCLGSWIWRCTSSLLFLLLPALDLPAFLLEPYIHTPLVHVPHSPTELVTPPFDSALFPPRRCHEPTCNILYLTHARSISLISGILSSSQRPCYDSTIQAIYIFVEINCNTN